MSPAVRVLPRIKGPVGAISALLQVRAWGSCCTVPSYQACMRCGFIVGIGRRRVTESPHHHATSPPPPKPQAGAAFMWRTTNIRMGVRLALVEPGTANALVFESARAAKHAAGGDACGAGGGGGSAAVSTAAAALAPPDDVTVTQLDMANTLLQSAVSWRADGAARVCAPRGSLLCLMHFGQILSFTLVTHAPPPEP